MSELKVITNGEIYNMIEYEGYCRTDDLYYIKSEADKVIAEKDSEIRRLENLCVSYRIDCDNIAIREANTYKEIERDNKQLRHHKYKRCLDKANYWLAVSYNCIDDEHRQKAEKHHYRWLKLAEKFKEEK